ncbi:zinc finger MYND domain-containing protein 11 isoform X1 [Dendroctonus ponderosae]|uniref:MYND-type domain-containing protein n=2 Tax=Dendroctonus ponderosae TaxID=77166 RepID=A0AAR5PKL4_DENPD|nr:zinc finger MYND domain-containing protein 11 isoform X1 [Dendroctonus ponderosae]
MKAVSFDFQVKMAIRRHCDPINVKKIWDAIRLASAGHQSCDSNRILKHFQKSNDCTQEQVELYINQCVKDGLIIVNKKANAEQTYKVTDQNQPQFVFKDWYCFECHLAGDVKVCENCFRVFHFDCIKIAEQRFNIHKPSDSLRSSIDAGMNVGEISMDISTSSNAADKSSVHLFNEKLCSVCNIINIDDCKMDKSEMNYLLKFVLHRIRTWLPYTITENIGEDERPSWLTDTELTWRANQLFCEHRDMSVLEVNLNSEAYNILSEFLADILTIQHNVAIFHGSKSLEHSAAEMMIRDALHDISELKNCVDCYKHSNEKIHLRWFTLPCRNPHELVWAKQKGYPYWPAKVIKETSSHYDVRFFGGKHERSLIHKSYIKPITVPKEKLKIKSSTAFTKALEELIYHQKLLSDPQEIENLLSVSKNKKVQKRPLLSVSHAAKSFKKKGQSPARQTSNSPAIQEIQSEAGSSDMSQRTPSKRPKLEAEGGSSEVISGNVIDISDGEEEETDYSFRGNSGAADPFRFDEHQEQVSSSTENYKKPPQSADLHQLDQPYSDSVEKMRRMVEPLSDKKEIIKCTMDCMQAEIDRITDEHNEHLKRLFESHNMQISETKKKQWCFNCEQDAIYHCCWNTAYCSQTCQQQHWQAEHKKVCRRKRQI